MRANAQRSRRPTQLTAAAATLLLALLVLLALAGSADAHGLRAHSGRSHSQHRATRSCARKRSRARHADCGRSARYRRHAAHRRKDDKAPVPTLATVAPAPTPSATCTNTELTPTSANVALVREATLCLINQQRADNGERPLVENANLASAAQGHSDDMVTRDYFEHATPSGEEFQTRITASGYIPRGAAYEIGENIDCATLFLATPAATVTAWMNSPEHRANILNGEFRDSGIGVAAAAPAYFAEGQPGATYTQDFGVLSR